MKKLFLAAVMMIGFAGISFAQTAKPATTDKAASKKEVKKPATTSAAKPAATATPATKPAAKTAPATAAKPASKEVVLKKDGTPDKRYKNTPKASGPTKKDGTPDKRYKENKKP